MIIHVVRSGETLYSISRIYGVNPEDIANANGIDLNSTLAVGQTLVVLIPRTTHTITAGETLASIARDYGTSVIQLLRNNPQVSDDFILIPGQKLVIDYDVEPMGNLAVIGYTYTNVDPVILRKTLPYLTYLTIFTYGITEEGDLTYIDDDELIELAKSYNVAPIMLISTLGPDGLFSNYLASRILNSDELSEKLIDQIIDNLLAKGYYGLDVDFENVLPGDRLKYLEFLLKLKRRLNENNLTLFVSLAPKTYAEQPGLLYEAHDYLGIGSIADFVLLMTYEWGYAYGPPMAVAPINKVKEVLDYAVTEIPPEKIFMGVPNYGYNWPLPFIQGETRARSLGNLEADRLAAEVGAEIFFDDPSAAPYFYYTDGEGTEHVVWFEDARSIYTMVETAVEYGLRGVGVWNIMRYFPQLWLVINSLVNIDSAIY